MDRREAIGFLAASAAATRAAILDEFFALGGRLIDFSPMYGSSQRVLRERMAADYGRA